LWTAFRRKPVHFGVIADTVIPAQTGLFRPKGDSDMRTLKLKLYPLAIAVIGAIAASGGYIRGR
jgi:hypothetical protein